MRGRLGSRLADLLALLVAVASVLALAEMAVRPFYAPPPRRPAPQVQCRFSPRFGWELTPDPAAWSLGERAAINRRGLRGAEVDYDRGADSAGVRWLLLGGGSAFGVGVDEKATFAAAAAAAVSASGSDSVRVINGACEGWDLHQCTQFLRLEGRFYHPDVVLLTFEPENLPPAGVLDTLYTETRFETVARRINRAPDGRPTWPGRLLGGSRLVGFLSARFHAFLQLGKSAESAAPVPPAARSSVRLIDILNGRDTPTLDQAWATVEREAAGLGESARSMGAAVYLVVLPLAPQLSHNYPRARYQDRLAQICRRNNFVMIDPLPELREARRSLNRLYLPRMPFLSAAAHRIVAQKLEAPLSNPQLLRSNWQLPSQGGE